MALLNLKLKGSTIIESIVATVIIMFCFSVVTTIYVNVFKNDDHARKLNGHILLKNVAMKIKSDRDFLDRTVKEEDYTIEKTVSKYGQSAGSEQQLWLLKIKLFDNDKKLLNEYKELVIN